MHPWLNWIEHLTTDQKVAGSNPAGCTNMKTSLIFFSFILFSSCSLIISTIADIKDINPTTGGYSIGTQRFFFVDSSRTNWYLDGYDKEYRKIMSQVWYPAIINSSSKKSKYIDNREALTETIKLQGYDVPSFLSSQVGSISCNSWEDATPVSNTIFPIIIFSHGHGGLRTQNTNQVEELVSHGYIVIAIDHTFDAGFIQFPDGEIAYSLTARPNDQPLIETPEQFYTRFSYRVDDVNFILNQIDVFDRYDNEIFSIMDKDNIGIFGHSFGGMTAFYSGYHNPKIKSCFALDGWFKPMPDTLITKNINKPIFHLGQNNKGEIKYWHELNYEKLESIMDNNSSFSVIIDIPGSYHFDYTDFTYFTYLTKKMNFSGSVSTETMAKIMNTTLLNFFDYSLKGEPHYNLSQYELLFPEVNIMLNKNLDN